MSSYSSLAEFYDILTEDVDYEAVLEFYERVFRLYGEDPKLVIDLACGTGTMTWLMAEKGYEMIGVDASFEMLAEAQNKDCSSCAVRPVFVNQSLEELDMYGTADAAVCCLDGINYVPQSELRRVFSRLNLFIRPGGVLIFDINSPEKLHGLDGQMYIDEAEGVYCVWRCEFDSDEDACFYGIDIFSKQQNGLWMRSGEEHLEYCHRVEDIKDGLEGEGFTDVKFFGGRNFREPKAGDMRVYVAARNMRK